MTSLSEIDQLTSDQVYKIISDQGITAHPDPYFNRALLIRLIAQGNHLSNDDKIIIQNPNFYSYYTQSKNYLEMLMNSVLTSEEIAGMTKLDLIKFIIDQKIVLCQYHQLYHHTRKKLDTNFSKNGDRYPCCFKTCDFKNIVLITPNLIESQKDVDHLFIKLEKYKDLLPELRDYIYDDRSTLQLIFDDYPYRLWNLIYNKIPPNIDWLGVSIDKNGVVRYRYSLEYNQPEIYSKLLKLIKKSEQFNYTVQNINDFNNFIYRFDNDGQMEIKFDNNSNIIYDLMTDSQGESGYRNFDIKFLDNVEIIDTRRETKTFEQLYNIYQIGKHQIWILSVNYTLYSVRASRLNLILDLSKTIVSSIGPGRPEIKIDYNDIIFIFLLGSHIKGLMSVSDPRKYINLDNLIFAGDYSTWASKEYNPDFKNKIENTVFELLKSGAKLEGENK